MERKRMILFCLVAAFFVALGSAYATKPGEELNPNGFPSGPHYNLNIHGKNADFTCPEQEYYLEITECPLGGCGSYAVGDLVETCPDGFTCADTDTPIYGNSIFVPENGMGIEIYMQSGKVGGKGKKAVALPQDELWAIDPCADFDGDGAIIQLPPGEYDVYARALAKPTDDPYMDVTPELFGAEDEDGNDLVYLGLVTETGFVKPNETFVRKSGKPTAIPITGLFEWTGDVCYFIEPPSYTVMQVNCCGDLDVDGVYDFCCYDSDGDLDYEADECSGDTDALTFPLVVGTDCTELTTYCNEYSNEWVFNIGDFVDYLWNADNYGLKLVQIRFYPREDE